MYAIIETGGKQYRVEEGEAVTIEKISGYREGDEIEFDKVLLIGGGKESRIGTPYLENAKVIGTIEEEGRGEKVIVFKYKPKKRYRRKMGHRQGYLRAQVKEIQG